MQAFSRLAGILLLLGLGLSGVVSSSATQTLPVAVASQVVATLQVNELAFPADIDMRNIKTDYGARGDGITNDTAAIQRALREGREDDVDYFGRPLALYFPAGTYLVSGTLEWMGCCVSIQGQGSGTTIIKLQDAAPGFTTPATPAPVIRTPDGNMSFRQNIADLTIDTGRNNPGAIGIDYISNNSGSLRNVVIRSGDRQGQVGLALTRQWPGPLLIKNMQIDGFDYGISVQHAEYGPTFEFITLTNQNTAGMRNAGNSLAIRGLQSTNSVPVIQNTAAFGSVIVLDGNFQGGAANVSAIENDGFLYARNITAAGYQSAIRTGGTVVPGLSQAEYISGQVYSLFTSPQRSLHLPIAETPTFHDNNLANWGKFAPRHYGDTEPLQPLLNSGKSTIYFPHGTYLFFNTTVVTVPATVRRIVGFSSVINRGDEGGGVVFRVAEDSRTPLIIEQFGYGVSVEHAANRPVVLKYGGYAYSDAPSSGALFLEDVELGTLHLNHPRTVWARQLNTESLDAPRTKIINAGGTLWILGIKTEGKGPVIDTRAGGKTELLGTLIYPVQEFSDAERQQPAFLSTDASMSLIYALSVYGERRNYAIQVAETRAGETRRLRSAQLPERVMPLFVGYPDTVPIPGDERLYLPVMRG